ncbi:hypothetical protein SRABI03_03149 [Microbacterium foliorum]|nr:hypothetical protein SRABI03_03149 [Microbacterium foliorum]
MPEVQRDLALGVGEFAGRRIQQHDRIAGKGAAHRADLHGLAGGVAHAGGHLGLTESVADRAAPGLAHPVDDLGVQRFAGADEFTRRVGEASEIRLDQHAPDRRRSAEGRDLMGVHDLHEGVRVEALVVVHEHRGLGEERGEEARPGVLGPARRRDVEVHVVGTHAQPPHGRQVPDRVRHVRVLHELRAAGGAAREIEQGGGVGGGRRVRLERRRCGGRVVEARPPVGDVVAHPDAQHLRVDVGDALGEAAGRHERAGTAVLHAVGEIGCREQRRGGDRHRPDLGDREHHLPQLDRVAEHHDHVVTAADADVGEP